MTRATYYLCLLYTSFALYYAGFLRVQDILDDLLADAAQRDAKRSIDRAVTVSYTHLGVTDRSYLFHISDALEAQDAAAALAQLDVYKRQLMETWSAAT